MLVMKYVLILNIFMWGDSCIVPVTLYIVNQDQGPSLWLQREAVVEQGHGHYLAELGPMPIG